MDLERKTQLLWNIFRQVKHAYERFVRLDAINLSVIFLQKFYIIFVPNVDSFHFDETNDSARNIVQGGFCVAINPKVRQMQNNIIMGDSI